MYLVGIMGAIYLLAVALAPVLLVGGVLQALFELFHLGPVLTAIYNSFHALSLFIQQFIPMGTLLETILYLFFLKLLIHVVTLHRDAEKYKGRAHFTVNLLISFVWLLVISSGHGPERDLTLWDYVSIVGGLVVLVITFFKSLVWLTKNCWKFLGKYPKVRQIRDDSFVRETGIFVLFVAILYLLYQSIRLQYAAGGISLPVFGGVALLLVVGAFFLQFIPEYLSDLNYFLKRTINKI